MTVQVLPNVPAVDRELFDYCKARDRVLELMTQGIAYIVEAEKISTQHVPYGFPSPLGRDFYGIDRFRRELDGRYWKFVLDRTGAAAIMDGEARKAFREQLEHGDVPEFTPDNITTHFLSMSQDAESMFDRGVYNLFRRYVRLGERGYETNRKTPFSIGRKLILDRWFSMSGWKGGYLHVGYHAGDEVNDFGRIVNLLAGKPYSVRGFEVAINAAMKDGSDVFENDLVNLRGFRNGNAHLWIKEPGVLDGINAAIARYCGDTLAQAHDPNYGRSAAA